MTAWWDGLDSLVKILYCVAVPSTLVLVIQTALAMLGGASSGAGIDASDTSGLTDFSGDQSVFMDSGLGSGTGGGPDFGELADGIDGTQVEQPFIDGGNPADFSVMRLFTIQGVVAFLTVFGWTAIVSIQSGGPEFLSLALGLAFGLAAMLAIAKLIQLSRKLTENGTINMRNAIGETGKVYIPIPPKSTGEGKLTMYIQGRYQECSAVTDGENTLSTGTMVRIVDFRNGVLVVEEDN